MDYAKINGRALTDNQIQQYFERLQLTSRYQQDNIFVLHTPNLELLNALQDAHLRHIPFDNLDILNEKTATLKRPDLFHKIILHNRGGICFELNGLFNWLLESLGYNVTSYAARYIDRFNPYQLRRHRLMCVKLEEQRYIVDVGVNSESPRKPLLLQTELVQDDGTSQYKFTQEDFYGWLLWQKEQDKHWKQLLAFTEDPQIDKDYIMPMFWCEKSPESPFVQGKTLSLFREDCNLTLRGNLMKFYVNGRIKYRYKITSGEELKSVLAEYFGINVSYPLKNDGLD